MLLTEGNRNRGVDRGAWERQFSYIRFFQRMPELLLPLRVKWLTQVDTVDEIFQDGGRRFGTIFAKFYENVHL